MLLRTAVMATMESKSDGSMDGSGRLMSHGSYMKP